MPLLVSNAKLTNFAATGFPSLNESLDTGHYSGSPGHHILTTYRAGWGPRARSVKPGIPIGGTECSLSSQLQLECSLSGTSR